MDSKKPHSLDLTLPLGGLLGFYGIVLIIYGLLGGSKMAARAAGINVNLLWGIVILVLGVSFFLWSLRNRRRRAAGIETT